MAQHVSHFVLWIVEGIQGERETNKLCIERRATLANCTKEEGKGCRIPTITKMDRESSQS